MATPMDHHHQLKATVRSTDPAFHTIRPERKRFVATNISATSAVGNLSGSGLLSRDNLDVFRESAINEGVAANHAAFAPSATHATVMNPPPPTARPEELRGRRRCAVPFGAHPEHRIGAFAKVSDLGDPALFPPNMFPAKLPPRTMPGTTARYETADGDVLVPSKLPVGAQDERFRIPDAEVLSMIPVPANVNDLFSETAHSAPLRTRPAAVVVKAAVPAPTVLPAAGDVALRVRSHLAAQRVPVEDVLAALATLIRASADAAAARGPTSPTAPAAVVFDGNVTVGVLSDALAAVGYWPSLDELKALRRDFAPPSAAGATAGSGAGGESQQKLGGSQYLSGGSLPPAAGAPVAPSSLALGAAGSAASLRSSTARRTIASDIGSRVNATLPVYRRGPLGSSDHPLSPPATSALRDAAAAPVAGAQLVDVSAFLGSVFGEGPWVQDAVAALADAAGLRMQGSAPPKTQAQARPQAQYVGDLAVEDLAGDGAWDPAGADAQYGFEGGELLAPEAGYGASMDASFGGDDARNVSRVRFLE